MKFATNPKYNREPADMLTLEHNIALIRWLARKGHSRCQEAGIFDLEYDDIEQEMMVSYLRTKEGFDMSAANNFSSYFVTSAWRNFNRTVLKSERNREVTPFSVEQMLEEYGVDLLELTEDKDTYLPEDHVEQTQAIRFVCENLGIAAKTVLHAMINPPKDLLTSFEAHRLEYEEARSEGEAVRTKKTISADFVIGWYGESRGLSDVRVSKIAKGVRQDFKRVADALTNDR